MPFIAINNSLVKIYNLSILIVELLKENQLMLFNKCKILSINIFTFITLLLILSSINSLNAKDHCFFKRHFALELHDNIKDDFYARSQVDTTGANVFKSDSILTENNSILIPKDSLAIAVKDSLLADTISKKESIKPEKLLYRSLLIPGWGHVAQKKYLMASGYNIALAGFITSEVYFNKNYNQLTTKLNNNLFNINSSQEHIQNLVKYKNRAHQLRRLSIVSAIATYSIQAIHAFTIAKVGQSTVVHNPTKAAFKSAVLPGWGQLYNQKWWKIPIVYAGLGTSTYFLVTNQNFIMDINKEIVRQRAGMTPSYTSVFYNYNESRLFLLKDRAARNRDISAISLVLIYLLNIVDAVVDAHLYDFSVDDDLSINFTPSLYNFNTDKLYVPSDRYLYNHTMVKNDFLPLNWQLRLTKKF